MLWALRKLGCGCWHCAAGMLLCVTVGVLQQLASALCCTRAAVVLYLLLLCVHFYVPTCLPRLSVMALLEAWLSLLTPQSAALISAAVRFHQLVPLHLLPPSLPYVCSCGWPLSTVL